MLKKFTRLFPWFKYFPSVLSTSFLLLLLLLWYFWFHRYFGISFCNDQKNTEREKETKKGKRKDMKREGCLLGSKDEDDGKWRSQWDWEAVNASGNLLVTYDPIITYHLILRRLPLDTNALFFPVFSFFRWQACKSLFFILSNFGVFFFFSADSWETWPNSVVFKISQSLNSKSGFLEKKDKGKR